MNPPAETIPQRVLAYELRAAIDVARDQRAPTPNRWAANARIARLVTENPKGWRSTHVRLRLGMSRYAWLWEFNLRLRKRSGRA